MARAWPALDVAQRATPRLVIAAMRQEISRSWRAEVLQVTQFSKHRKQAMEFPAVE